MTRRIFASAVCALVLSAGLVSAFQAKPANLTGAWAGTFKSIEPPDDDEAYMVLKHTGKELTGTAGPNPQQQWNIAKGVVAQTKEGTTVTFEVATGEGPVLQFALKLVDGHLKGTARAERDGRKLLAEVDVQRTK